MLGRLALVRRRSSFVKDEAFSLTTGEPVSLATRQARHDLVRVRVRLHGLEVGGRVSEVPTRHRSSSSLRDGGNAD